ncbi:MAG: VWA domain-containing protein, partial [Actinomycetota bacterium]|nr:VWA domain-containing protein [Actinomycetota bacterium]
PADDAGHLRAAVRETKAGRLLILAVDLSGSMGAPERAAAATGTVLGLLSQAYQRRDQVALIGFRAEGAQVLLAPTTSVEVARNRLGGLATGGVTPLAAGLHTALGLAARRPPTPVVPVLAVLTDGRATGGPGALDDALAAAGAVRTAGLRALVLDCETGTPRLGLARRLAEAMGAEHVPVDGLDPVAITTIIRRTTGVA